ncbi:MAG: c-type cytochrome [Trueperaceae bacterium]|nr:c-type cytochrome [Trueperaceae bacterium]
MAHGANEHKKHGVGEYIVVALILGVITYVEFAIVEYEIAWLGDTATLWLLMILSVVKFVMVILFFMHLKDDDVTYSGFFASGMVMGLGTFVAFVFLMTAPSSLSFVRSQVAPEGQFLHGEAAEDDHGDEGLDERTLELIESDGYARELSSVLGDARPKNLSWSVAPPAAQTEGWTLTTAAPPAAQTESDEAPVEADGAGAVGDDGEAAGDEATAAQAADGVWDEELGAQVYGANCASCHQANGQGIPGAFPPLADHVPDLLTPDGGRTYLIDTLLYGLQGQIRVSGQTYNGVMPAWSQLDDEQIAAVTNYVSHEWDNAANLPDGFTPFDTDEVASERGKGLAGSDVHDLRDELALP